MPCTMARTVRRRSKTTPRVKDGRVQRKNHRDVSTGDGDSVRILVEVPGLGYRHVVTREQIERFVQLIPDWPVISRGLDEIAFVDGSESRDGYYWDGSIEVTAWCDPPPIVVNAHYYADHRHIWERLGVPKRSAPSLLGTVYGHFEGDEVGGDLQTMLWDHFEVYAFTVKANADHTQWEIFDDDSSPGTLIAEVTQIGGELHVYETCMSMQFTRKTAAAYQLLHVLLHELGHHVDAMQRPHRGWSVRGESYAEYWAERCATQIWDEAMRLFRQHER